MSVAHRQHGVALVIALMFLLVLTLIGVAAMHSSVVEIRLARNTQFRIEAMQKAQAVIDAVLADADNFSAYLPPGEQIWYPDRISGNGVSCDSNSLKSTLGSLPISTGLYAEVRRLRPAHVPPLGRSLTSMDKFTSAAFAVRGVYDRSEDGLGAADLEQGVIKILPVSSRIQ